MSLSCRCKTTVENSLRDAELKFKDIDEVILVGGSTRIPIVQEVVRKQTWKEPNVTVNPDEVVALGAAVQVCSRKLGTFTLFSARFYLSGLIHLTLGGCSCWRCE